MAEQRATYLLTEHVCLICLGRVLRSTSSPVVYRCSNCGVEAVGRQGLSHPPICACSSKLGKRDAGIRCIRNERPRPEFPSEIIAKEFG